MTYAFYWLIGVFYFDYGYFNMANCIIWSDRIPEHMNKNKNNQLFKIIFAGLAVVLVLGFILLKPKKIENSLLSKVTIGSVSEVVSGSGSVESGGVTAVYSPTNGVIKKILVTDGQEVKKDQPLFEVSSTATTKEKSEALSSLLTARSALKKAENAQNTLQSDLEIARRKILEAENTKKTFDENVLAQKPNPGTGRAYTEEEKLAMSSTMESTRKEFKNTEKEYVDATDSIRAASASLSEANIAYMATMDSVTKSPIGGKVVNLKKRAGNSVDISKEVLMVMSSSDLLVSIKISEFNIGKIKAGQKVESRFDAFPDQRIEGEVIGVDTVGNETSGTVSFEVLVALKPTGAEISKIKPAMTVNLNIIAATRENVLTIPRSATKLEGGKDFVLVNDNGKPVKKEIVLGVVGASSVEVVDGLSESEEILTVFTEK